MAAGEGGYGGDGGGAPLLDCLSVLLSYKHTQVGLPALSPPCDWFGGVASHLQSLSSDFAPGKKKGLDSVVIELGTPENSQRAERIHRGVGWRRPPGLIQQAGKPGSHVLVTVMLGCAVD